MFIYPHVTFAKTCKFLNYLLVSYTIAATFQMARYSEEYMFDFYKSSASQNDFEILGKLVILFKEKRLPRKTKVLYVSQKLIKIVYFV